MKRTACFKGMNVSRVADSRLTTMSVLGVLQRQLTTHVDKINSLVRTNQRLTIRELAEECGISVGSCYEILTTKLKMHRIAAKFVPRLMTDDEKANRARIFQELLDRSDEDETSCHEL